MKIRNNSILIYTVLSFFIAWAIWIICYLVKIPMQTTMLLSTLCMWAPALAVFITSRINKSDKILKYSLKPNLKNNKRWYLIAWITPLFFSIAGGILYYLVFPNDFDSSMGYMALLIGKNTLEASGMSMTTVLMLQTLGSVIYGPLINMFAALGEEIGWRGFLFPALAEKYSIKKAHVMVGIIWGIWHTPINMMGHNYGMNYWGYLWLGVIAMSVATFSMGVFLSVLTEKTGSIWIAALGHGAINAVAGIPVLFRGVLASKHQVFGPGLSGLISVLPLFIVALVIVIKSKNKTLEKIKL
ncbi:CPBP family intramembrane glutamic endopeptidase [Peptostreptococcus faecalis]|uniref:CPBP family intramembrane glutamic endopeptidase n=1 Tax=Peptostreptococcus faecalis TaxID=2045015 RepID=UPI000C79679B|nr:CPBP family intramembrane glutamic endopeptidase [Peptostreptococcus faecalis]